MVVGEFTQETDLLVVGGGTTGAMAAQRAAALGLSVIVVDPHLPHPGGTSIEHVVGRAHFTGGRTAQVTRDDTPGRIRFRRAVIATGASPPVHPAIDPDLGGVLAPPEVLRMAPPPNRVLVVGGGGDALETASRLAHLGSRVTLACEASRLLGEADPDLVAPMAASLERVLKGLGIGVAVESARGEADGLVVTMGGEEACFDAVVVAGAGAPATEGLSLERTKVRLDADGRIVVDETMRTADDRILAAGEVTGSPMSAALARVQGRIAAEVAAGRDSHLDATVIPRVVDTDPAIAWCGVTENEAKADGISHAVGIDGDDGSVTKIIHDPQRQLVLGVGCTGPGAVAVIAEATLAIELGATLYDMASVLHPSPSYGERLSVVARAVLDAR